MNNRSIAQCYAKVLFALDRKDGHFEQRLEDFDLVSAAMMDNPEVIKFLKSPQVNLCAKKKLFQDSFKDKFDTSFLNFLFYLIQKGRAVNIRQIAYEYRLLVNRIMERWEADIVTAVPMDSNSESNLKQKLEKIFHKKININKKIDPTIIGGVILIMANEMLDWSVKGRLKKLKEDLMATKV